MSLTLDEMNTLTRRLQFAFKSASKKLRQTRLPSSRTADDHLAVAQLGQALLNANQQLQDLEKSSAATASPFSPVR